MTEETEDRTLTSPYFINEGTPGYVPYGSNVPDFFIPPWPQRPLSWRRRLKNRMADLITDTAEGIAAWILR